MQLLDAGKAVRAAQHNAGISNAELSRIANTSPQQVIRWRSQKNIKLHTMQHICDALNVDIITFFRLGS
jgi:DNA-binding Xre family transcriptional regulator